MMLLLMLLLLLLLPLLFVDRVEMLLQDCRIVQNRVFESVDLSLVRAEFQMWHVVWLDVQFRDVDGRMVWSIGCTSVMLRSVRHRHLMRSVRNWRWSSRWSFRH